MVFSWVLKEDLGSNMVVVHIKLAGSHFEGIVSRDFEVCFLVPLDRSDIASPDGAGSFKKSDFVLNFYFSGLGGGSFHRSTSRL
jgi:hypothetical protein